MKMFKIYHKYIGIFLSYIGFFIFFSGAFAYYRGEITLFMQPEFYKLDYKSQNWLKNSIDYLSKNHKNSDIWEITLPSQISPYVFISYNDDKNIKQNKLNKPQIKINPQNAEVVNSKPTYGGSFIGKLHYNLWYISSSKAKEIVGYITLFMILVILTGILIYNKKIFKNFFKFNKKNLWIDTHLIAGISGIFIFFSLCISGLFIVEKHMLKDFYEKHSSKKDTLVKPNSNSNISDKNKISYLPTYLEIEKIIKNSPNLKNLRSIIIDKDAANVRLNFYFHNPYKQQNPEIYDIKTSKLIGKVKSTKSSYYQEVNFFMKVFHKGRFGEEITKFILFIFGILGLFMCFSGVIFWQQKLKSLNLIYFYKFLNSSIFIGLFTSFGVYLLSTWIVLDVRLRQNLQVDLFFISFVFVMILSLILVKKYSYTTLSFITSFLFLASAIMALIYGSYLNFASLKITLLCFILSGIFGYLSNKFYKVKK
ncbi:PepSY domain-containing protein [Campylobacter sp. FMV-PI01]|uniref:PepSY domain-containing protein n=1 Tax=Campylobacter portucalensis TaxID=2608384 RepID=A0A6L5WIP4_9BACT|nr:PepSY-associated TM helix domain-containing protein [Campylobacter portucalensis]MSN96836.1 PepSY domain-containing protein [Campylobacter portucalensis]